MSFYLIITLSWWCLYLIKNWQENVYWPLNKKWKNTYYSFWGFFWAQMGLQICITKASKTVFCIENQVINTLKKQNPWLIIQISFLKILHDYCFKDSFSVNIKFRWSRIVTDFLFISYFDTLWWKNGNFKIF